MSLFQRGQFTLHSGDTSNFKIDCDHLTDSDWEALAHMIADRVGRYSYAVGVPTGGLRLAEKLNEVSWSSDDPVLIVDDVLTTGASMEEMRSRHSAKSVKGAVVFARGPVPAWITPLFTLT